MKPVTLYTTRFCPFCIRAKQLLEHKHVPYKEIAVDNNPRLLSEMMAKSRRRTVPQIWIGDQHIGGCDDLYALERNAQLDELLN